MEIVRKRFVTLANYIKQAISDIQPEWDNQKCQVYFKSEDPIGSLKSWLQDINKELFPTHFYSMVLLIDEALEITEWDERVQKLIRNLFSNIPWIRGVLAGPLISFKK